MASEGPVTIRVVENNRQIATISAVELLNRLRPANLQQPSNFLALSGGGAGGAFGAGALIGMGKEGQRPPFDVVTGVSVGALIAPFAFLGPAWDPLLRESYDGTRSQHLLERIGPIALFGSSLYRGTPLRKLVADFVDDKLIEAIAVEARKGRLLLVATTDIDQGSTVVWDMGSIALNGGPRAKTLFREVLVASASIPGLFPPELIRLEENGQLHEEMHVDGGVSVPFFVFPNLAELPPEHSARLQGAHVYLLLDRPLNTAPKSTSRRTVAIVSRSVETTLQLMLTTHVELTAALAEQHAMTLRVAGVPDSYPFAGSFDFRANSVRPLFERAFECARADRLWMSSDHWRGGESVSGRCPADPPDPNFYAVETPSIARRQP